MPEPRPLPAALAGLVSAAVARGETSALLPMKDFWLPSGDYEFRGLTPLGEGRLAKFALASRGGGPDWLVWVSVPLLPGEVVRVECRGCKGAGFELDLETAKREAAAGSDWPSGRVDCSGCDGSGHVDLRILSDTPERWCEVCQVSRPEDRNTLIPDCPTCHGHPPWVGWRVAWEEVA